jgi:hypothetical protein
MAKHKSRGQVDAPSAPEVVAVDAPSAPEVVAVDAPSAPEVVAVDAPSAPDGVLVQDTRADDTPEELGIDDLLSMLDGVDVDVVAVDARKRGAPNLSRLLVQDAHNHLSTMAEIRALATIPPEERAAALQDIVSRAVYHIPNPKGNNLASVRTAFNRGVRSLQESHIDYGLAFDTQSGAPVAIRVAVQEFANRLKARARK